MQGNSIQSLAGRYLRQQSMLYGDLVYLPKREKPLENYHHTNRNCDKCKLSETRKNLVFGAGNPYANLMLIGEAPGEQEDIQGIPFVGKAGQLLDKILASIDFSREEVYICNILKCRPPNNRDPLPEEISLCIPHLLQQIDIIKPQILLALGRIAAQALLNSSDSLSKLRSAEHEFHGIPLLATYHPAALLRNQDYKRPTWEDVQKLRKLYDELVGDKVPWQPK